MSQFCFPPHFAQGVPVMGNPLLFPVRRIYCIGQNYLEHAKEMGATEKEQPFFFGKPADAVLPVSAGGIGQMTYPSMTEDLQYEVELVVAIGKQGKNISVEKAKEYIFGYAVGLDMTRRDLQREAKKTGRPWCSAKGFDQSAPIAPLYPVAEKKLMSRGLIRLSVNGEIRQESDLAKMIWNLEEIITYLSQYNMLQPGDLIFTGTPAGVSKVQPGDKLEAEIENLGKLMLKIV